MANAKTKGGAKATKATKAAKGRAPAPALKIDVPPEVVGNEAAYDAYLPAARALTGTIKPFRADASLAYHNIDVGLAAVKGARATIDDRVKRTDWAALLDAPNLALAVCFAATAAANTTVGDTGVRAKLAEARKLRRRLLRAARSLADATLFPEKDVDAIERGAGALDSAQDCVALAALFRKHAAKVKGKHALTAAQITRAAELGSELTTLLKPARAKPAKQADAITEATAARDRLWTLLVGVHKELRRLGMFVWVDEVDEHVPVLQASRSLRRTPKPAPPAPAPAPAPAPEPEPEPVDGGAS